MQNRTAHYARTVVRKQPYNDPNYSELQVHIMLCLPFLVDRLLIDKQEARSIKHRSQDTETSGLNIFQAQNLEERIWLSSQVDSNNRATENLLEFLPRIKFLVLPERERFVRYTPK